MVIHVSTATEFSYTVSVKAFICLIVFLLFCVAARWYKRRVRDDEYSTQQVVEEVYDQFLTAATANSRTYDASNKSV